MKQRVLVTVLVCRVALFMDLSAEVKDDAIPIVYGQRIRVPLPLPMVSDYRLLDWDNDGLLDILTLPQGYSMYLHKNIGTRDDWLFNDG